ncbi:DEAD/DEAH box helicase family protein [Candidatus Peregrinibacteria bacterium]|nr:DEAD/DEAH box helicase family protein [Candidatus Peregrinibacteria bacterium]
MFKKPFVVLDIETTGIDPKRDDIIEVAAIRYEGGKEVGRYESLIKIDYKLPELIIVITNITDDMLKKEGRTKEEVFREIEDILEGAYLIGHNIAFDAGFLKAKKVAMDTLGNLDTIPLAQILFPAAPSYSLESLTDDFEIEHKNRHRAMGDVEATLDLFKHLWETAEKLPKKLVEEIKEHLPRSDWDGKAVFEELKGSPARAKSVSKKEAEQVLNQENGVQRPLTIDEIFGDDGAIKKCLESYEGRPQQVEMAQGVLNAFEQGYHLICEAPTGVGKSLAYLAAAANIAIANKSKVVITTNTLNLQQQLYEKDVPLLQTIYQKVTRHPGIRVAVLKGRSHYLCLRRFAEFKRRSRFTPQELVLLIKVLIWIQDTENGDASEIHLTREENLIWDFELCADKKYCTPQKCKNYGPCYLERAREKAENADVIIVNHALLCADLATGGGLLPDYRYLVADEAHHFEEVVTKAFGVEVAQEHFSLPIKVIKGQLEDLKRRFSGTLFTVSDVFEDINPILEQIPEIQQLLDNFFTIVALFVNRNVPDSGYVENLLVDGLVTSNEEWLNLGESLKEVAERLDKWMKQLTHFAEALEMAGQPFPGEEIFLDEFLQEIGLLKEQFIRLRQFFDEEHEAKTLIRWIVSGLDGKVAIRMAPIAVGDKLKEKLYGQKTSIVFTSATLGVRLSSAEDEQFGTGGHPFTYLRQVLSLDENFEELILDSPFNFETQAYVIVPNDLLPLTAKNSIVQISDFMARLIKATGGSTLGLFTSYGALENIYLNLTRSLTPKDARVLAQRISGGRNKVFKAYMNDPQHSVLLGTNSFWEGVDIPGDALTSLVIHKLPFDVPSEPISRVRSQMFGNGFYEYSVPRAILRFRQGFGRLIRSTKDYGIMVVLDNRVLTKDFGKLFLQALPSGITIEQMPLADVPAKVKEWLDLYKEEI